MTVFLSPNLTFPKLYSLIFSEKFDIGFTLSFVLKLEVLQELVFNVVLTVE